MSKVIYKEHGSPANIGRSKKVERHEEGPSNKRSKVDLCRGAKINRGIMRLSNTMIHGICTRWYTHRRILLRNFHPAKALSSNFIAYRDPLFSMHLWNSLALVSYPTPIATDSRQKIENANYKYPVERRSSTFRTPKPMYVSSNEHRTC